MLKLYNTLSRKVEVFQPLLPGRANFYACGPTVYNFAHIGNLRTYVFEDILRRVLEYNGYKVKHAMNVTDVGHLTSDADEGEDKLEVGARREGKGPLEIAKFYEAKFFEDLRALNVKLPAQVLRATNAIAEQLEIIRLLTQKGFTYQDDSAIYFDTAKFPGYGALSGQNLADKKTGARREVVVDAKKRSPQDFALWFFLAGKYKNHVLHWPSPWGEGFPGWHIECSAISRKLLGQPFDIHAGGVDHIGTHHQNEIAQSEAAFGLPLVRYWMHGEFLLIDGGRMGKSEGNFITLNSLKPKGFLPLDFRYLCLTAHYRSQLNFTWESQQAAAAALNKLYDFVRNAGRPAIGCAGFEADFLAAVNNDLNLPEALSVVWKLLGDPNYPAAAKLASLLKFDAVLGLGLAGVPALKISPELQKLINQREAARRTRDFEKSDALRRQIADLGFELEDTAGGPKIKKLNQPANSD